MSPKSKQAPGAILSSDSILAFMTEYGRAYLASGGPTSRLEDDLSQLGRKMGYPSEVFATPTGIFVSCVDRDGTNHTTLSRIKEGGINLGRLCWLEGIFQDIYNGKITLTQGNRIVQSAISRKSAYPTWILLLAAFAAGFALSFAAYTDAVAGIVSGLITMIVWWVSGPAMRSRVPSAIFRDFFASATTLALSGFVQHFYPAPFEALSIGGIVLIVPGLALTTAISELADQNLVSGTSKLMNAVLTLLAMVLAFILFQDLADSLSISQVASAGPRPLPLALAAVGTGLSTVCFGILFRVPLRSLPWATATGLLGWFILRLLGPSNYIAAASYLAAFGVGLVSLFLGFRARLPSQVFSVPGILAMLPGMLAFNSFRSAAMGQGPGLELAATVAVTSASIVFGLFTARIPFLLAAGPKTRQY